MNHYVYMEVIIIDIGKIKLKALEFVWIDYLCLLGAKQYRFK